MSEQKTCKHGEIVTWHTDDGTPEMWSCSECRHKFVPIAELMSVERDLAAAVARAEAAEADARRYRKALIEIRDSTYRNAVTLRGIANNAIDAMKEPKNGS